MKRVQSNKLDFSGQNIYVGIDVHLKSWSVAIPDFITFLRHHMAHIENQLITSNNWVVLGGASEKHVPL